MSLIRTEGCVHANTLNWRTQSRQEVRLCLNLCSWRVAPQPAHRVGENGRAVVGGMAPVAENGLVVVILELERRFHLLVGEVPVAELVVQIVAAVLQENADVFL